MTTLITGGGSGIGAAAARRIAHHGPVLVADINIESAEAIAAAICSDGGMATAAQLDVADGSAVKRLFAEQSAISPVRKLFCNAGVNIRHRAEEISLDDWRTMMSVHVKGAFLCAQAAIPGMRDAGGGAIVMMSSDYAVLGMAASPAYAAAKTAVYSLVKCFALEFASFGVRVNALGPGPIDTPLLRGGRDEGVWRDAERRLLAGIPMGRLGRPDEVAAAAEFLLSERASYITGQILHPNGGQLTW